MVSCGTRVSCHPPVTLNRSTPARANTLHASALASASFDSGTKSLPATRIPTIISGPAAARTFSTTSRPKRVRASKVPPYSSVLRFVTGERNWLMR